MSLASCTLLTPDIGADVRGYEGQSCAVAAGWSAGWEDDGLLAFCVAIRCRDRSSRMSASILSKRMLMLLMANPPRAMPTVMMATMIFASLLTGAA